jgi:CRP/FNR family transcriptional regulator, nitrogen oxide reductase regulator
MSNIDRSLVSSLPIFADLTAAEIDDILREARSLHFAKETRIFEEGQEAHLFYLLLNGRVRAQKLTQAGDQVVIRFIAPGEMFGVAMAIGHDAYPAAAVAVVDSVALAWPNSAWPRLVARHTNLAVHTMQTLGARLQESQTRLMEMSTQQVEQRIAHTLLRLLDQGGRENGEGVLIDFPISRKDIAEMVGTTLHTVSRIMSAWESRGLVSSGRQRVIVRDRSKLSLIANSGNDP